MPFRNDRMISFEMKIPGQNGNIEKENIDRLDANASRRITTINRWLVEHGYDIVRLWADIDDIIIKVLISAHSVLKHNYRACFPHHYRGSACFEILGFDILLDRKLKPYVLEVRTFPSFPFATSPFASGESLPKFHHRLETRSGDQRCSDLRHSSSAKHARCRQAPLPRGRKAPSEGTFIPTAEQKR